MATAKIAIRTDTAANWTSADTVLETGEQGHETDTGRRKIGDGTTAWTSLAYVDAELVSNDHLVGLTATQTLTNKTIAGANVTDNLVMSAGKGLDFSASEGAGASSSVLDDYEEGTWTGVLKDVDDNVVSTQTGNYRKVGKLVFVNWDTVFTSASGDEDIAKITGLPFPSISTGAIQFTAQGTVQANRGFPVATVRVGKNESFITITSYTSGPAAYTSFGTGTSFSCSLVYPTE